MKLKPLSVTVVQHFPDRAPPHPTYIQTHLALVSLGHDAKEYTNRHFGVLKRPLPALEAERNVNMFWVEWKNIGFYSFSSLDYGLILVSDKMA